MTILPFKPKPTVVYVCILWVYENKEVVGVVSDREVAEAWRAKNPETRDYAAFVVDAPEENAYGYRGYLIEQSS